MDDDEAKEEAFEALLPAYEKAAFSLNVLKIGFDEGWAAARRTAAPEGDTVLVPKRLLDLLLKARAEGWYEDNPGWDEVERLLPQRVLPRDKK